MIRKLEEKDRNITLDFLSDEPAINLFMVGDIEVFGFDEDFQKVWGQFNENNKLEGVLLKYNENFIPYWKSEGFDIAEFKNIILNTKGKVMISGKESIVQQFDGILPNHKSKSTYFCELKEGKKLKLETDGIMIADESDSERVYHLIDGIEEFFGFGNSVERIRHKFEKKSGRIYYVENKEGEMVSVSQTTAENSKSAMVVGVATKKDYRGQGLMSRCLSKLCYDILEEGKTLCLFYDNPKAGSVYHKLGFKSIDNWMMITEKKES